MAVRRDIIDALDLARGIDVIDDMDYHLLSNVNKVNRPNLEIPYWQYQRFDLDRMTDYECKVEFRFTKNDIYDLVDIMLRPEILDWSPYAWTIWWTRSFIALDDTSNLGVCIFNNASVILVHASFSRQPQALYAKCQKTSSLSASCNHAEGSIWIASLKPNNLS